MKQFAKNALQQGCRHLACSAGFFLHSLFLLVGVWALFLVLGALITPDVLLTERMTRLILHFKPTSVLVMMLLPLFSILAVD
ncbi:TPA: hypothetical protein ACPSKE_002873 [Legionella feeleii]